MSLLPLQSVSPRRLPILTMTVTQTCMSLLFAMVIAYSKTTERANLPIFLPVPASITRGIPPAPCFLITIMMVGKIFGFPRESADPNYGGRN